MINKDTYIDKIMAKLAELNIYKVILFGSYADGSADEESNIDLLIILDENTLPENYDDWLEKKTRVRRYLREVNDDVALDLLIYTRPQYEMIIKEMNAFQREIHEKGKILYEKAS